MKKLLLSIAILCMALIACQPKNDKLSTDLINIGKTADNPDVKKQAVITFDKTEYDFGKLLQGEKVTYTFKFKNTGNVPLIISEVAKTCGCTASEYSQKPIAPNESGSIKVTFDSKGLEGFQSKTIQVGANTIPPVTNLRIKAVVKTADNF